MKTLSKQSIARVISVGGFGLVSAVGFVHFWTGAGGTIPGVTDQGRYDVSFIADNVSNLRPSGDVSIAGVVIGKVTKETLVGGRTRVDLSLDGSVAPLHDGATVRIGMKSIVGQSYVDLVDGTGSTMPAGSTLPAAAVTPPVDINHVLSIFDPKTRKSLSGTVQALATATGGTSKSLDALMTGLGQLGRQGYTAVDAIAAQSNDLRSLVGETNSLMNALNTNEGQIASLVQNAQRLTVSTSNQSAAIAQTVQSLPSLLATARTATGSLGALGTALTPVAANLRAAAPGLTTALDQLPAVTSDLRGLLPDLDATLGLAPATLTRVPAFGSELSSLLPAARVTLADVNPMLDYLRPYGRDIGAMFASFGGAMDVVDANGVRPIRVAPIFNSRSVTGLPLPLTIDPLHWNNPYPVAGTVGSPTSFKGSYPRVQKAPQ